MSVREGSGFAAANLSDLGEGHGFRKIRKALGVTAFGANAIVIPEGFESGRHYHEIQEELYFVHRGRLCFTFGEGEESVEVGEGGLVWVDAPTIRKIKNVGEGDAVYLIVGGKDGYVPRDGVAPDGDRLGTTAPPAA